MKVRRKEIEVFFSHVVSTDNCWLWGGYVQNAGYGSFNTFKRPLLAHRFSYEYFIEKIKPKMTIDHLCKNKLCVNPNHLEEVTRQENIKRAGLLGFALKESLKTHCPKGHSYVLHARRFANGNHKDGTVKYSKRCLTCYPKYKRYESLPV